jgi:hypothetical protein
VTDALVEHCPRCNADVTVNDYGRCTYCSTRILDPSELDADPEPERADVPALSAGVCRACGLRVRKWDRGRYAGLCEPCAEPLRKRSEPAPASPPPAPRTAAKPAAQPASVNGRGGVEARLSGLVSAARRIDAARALLVDLEAKRVAAEAELEQARADLRTAVTSIDTEALTG